LLNYTRLLNYFIGSDLFDYFIDSFFTTYQHFGKCQTKTNIICKFYSDTYKAAFSKGQIWNRISIPEKTIEQYFNQNYSDEQLFALVYGHWLGYTTKDLKAVGNIEQSKHSWKQLNQLLFSKPIGKPDLYFVDFDGHEESASMNHGVLFTADNQFHIIDS